MDDGEVVEVEPLGLHELPIGELWVNENDVGKVCCELGMEHYYWPVVEWPYSVDGIEMRSTESHAACCESAISPKIPDKEKTSAHPNEVATDEVGLDADEVIKNLLPVEKNSVHYRLSFAAARAYYIRTKKLPGAKDIYDELLNDGERLIEGTIDKYRLTFSGVKPYDEILLNEKPWAEDVVIRRIKVFMGVGS